MKVIPEKEITIVNLESQKEKTFTVFKESSQNNNRFEEIKKFKELLDCGIITEEEFQTKRQNYLICKVKTPPNVEGVFTIQLIQ